MRHTKDLEASRGGETARLRTPEVERGRETERKGLHTLETSDSDQVKVKRQREGDGVGDAGDGGRGWLLLEKATRWRRR